jgi:hypothetical protein
VSCAQKKNEQLAEAHPSLYDLLFLFFPLYLVLDSTRLCFVLVCCFSCLHLVRYFLVF